MNSLHPHETGERGLSTSTKKSPLYVAKELIRERYNGADGIFVAGSVVRGEASTYSDLDLVVLFPKVKRAYRESYYYGNWPIEAFVHDPETLTYFLSVVDYQSGLPALHQMLMEGIFVPDETETSLNLQNYAREVFEQGPPPLTEEQNMYRRYQISEILDDIRDPRSRDQLVASACRLYRKLADFYFRTHGHWSARGKALPKQLRRVDSELYHQFTQAFEDLFTNNRPQALIRLGDEILAMGGGNCFEGFYDAAPIEWRKKL